MNSYAEGVRLGKVHPRRIGARFGLPIFVVLLCALASALQPGFLAIKNLQDILTRAAPLCVVALGQSFVILLRGLDLSIGSLMATVAVLAAALGGPSDFSLALIIPAALLFSVLVGAINGWLITERKVSPFLATLAVMIILQGLRFAYTQGAPSGDLPRALRFLGTGRLLGVPANMLLCLVIAAGLAVFLHRTRPGRMIYMVGGNPRSADLVGVDSARVTMIGYIICSVLTGVAGLLLVGYVGTVDNWVGRGYELDSIVAAVIGGVRLGGGSGTVGGALLGALVLVLISNIVLILGLPVQAQLILKGIIIIAAAAVYLKRSSSS